MSFHLILIDKRSSIAYTSFPCCFFFCCCVHFSTMAHSEEWQCSACACGDFNRLIDNNNIEWHTTKSKTTQNMLQQTHGYTWWAHDGNEREWFWMVIFFSRLFFGQQKNVFLVNLWCNWTFRSDLNSIYKRKKWNWFVLMAQLVMFVSMFFFVSFFASFFPRNNVAQMFFNVILLMICIKWPKPIAVCEGFLHHLR